MPEKQSVLIIADLEPMLTWYAARPERTPDSKSIFLQYLMHTNQVVSRTHDFEHVWNEAFNTFTNVIDVYIKYLRNKIDKDHKKKLPTPSAARDTS